MHGRDHESKGQTETAAAGGEVKRKPNCVDCHQEHNLALPESARFRRDLPDRLAQCHTEQSTGYALSMHGQLTKLGYGPAALCSDCHGAHDIRPLSDPASALSASQREATCAKCHPDAPRNLSD